MAVNVNDLEVILKFAINIINLSIIVAIGYGIMKTKNRIATFKGDIVDSKLFRHYECHKCHTRINIQKDNVCKKCNTNLF